MTTATETKGPEKRIGLDLEPPVREAIRVCDRHDVRLSGSSWEKARRDAVRLHGEVHALGGGVGVTGAPQVVRQAEIARLRPAVEAMMEQVARFRTAHIPAPIDLLDRLDRDTLELDAVERAFAEGRVQLNALATALTAAEHAARHGLATTLRQRVLEKIAAKLEAVLPAATVVLCARQPARGIPDAAHAQLGEATAICALADRLTGENAGLDWLVVALKREDVCALLFPKVAAEQVESNRSLAAREVAAQAADLARGGQMVGSLLDAEL